MISLFDVFCSHLSSNDFVFLRDPKTLEYFHVFKKFRVLIPLCCQWSSLEWELSWIKAYFYKACLMTKENINVVEDIFYFNFKQFLQISIMNAIFPIGGLGCALNPWLAEHIPYFFDLLDSCMLPWKLWGAFTLLWKQISINIFTFYL